MVSPDQARDSGLERPPAGQPTVLWDFDGTLVSRDGNWRSALLTALDQITDDHGVTMDQVRAGLQDGFPWHHPEVPHPQLDTSQRWWQALDAALRRAYLVAGTDERTAALAAAKVPEIYLDPGYWSVFADTRPALRRLRDHGYRNVVVSNHVPELADLVRRLGLSDLVDLVLSSAVTGYEKPHRGMFEIALELSGHPDPVWMIGDNPAADVAGAESAGIPAILVRGPAGTGGTGLAAAVDRVLSSHTHPRRR